MRWPLQPLQPFQQTQLQPPFGQSVDSLCHPWFTTSNVSYRFPILKLPPPPCAVLLVQLHYIALHPAVVVRWPLQTVQPFQKTQLQPPFGPSVDSLCHPWFTATNLSYRFPIFEIPPLPCAVLLVYTLNSEPAKGQGVTWNLGSISASQSLPANLWRHFGLRWAIPDPKKAFIISIISWKHQWVFSHLCRSMHDSNHGCAWANHGFADGGAHMLGKTGKPIFVGNPGFCWETLGFWEKARDEHE